VPTIDWNLAGDDEGAGVVAVLDDLQQIARLIADERLRPPIVEDQQSRACDLAQQPAVASIACATA
jgi:hypothetical protein